MCNSETITMVQQSWHIPRASLGSGSSNNSSTTNSANGSQLSHSNASSVKHGKRHAGGRRGTSQGTQRSTDSGVGHKNRGYLSDGDGGDDGLPDNDARRNGHAKLKSTRVRRANSSERCYDNYLQQQQQTDAIIGSHPNGGTPEFVPATQTGGVKRSSQSSQGSTDSNHSSHSASSGSMLLTAANLEQLAQIHKRNELNQTANSNGKSMLQANVERLTSTYSANITAAVTVAAVTGGSPSTIISISGAGADRLKDADTMSLASSTHFTMVNGVGGPQRKHKSGLCDRGHQITVLILTMSAIFLIGICGAVFMLELRAKKMMSSTMSMYNMDE